VIEVAVAAVAEAVARHVDRRAKAPTVEEACEALAFSGGQQRVGDRKAAVVELRPQAGPVQHVDAWGDGYLDARIGHAV
jgi:hypothetical protein